MSWKSLKYQRCQISQSSLCINRDSIMILVKDNAFRLREDLTPEELELYGSGQFLSHLEQKRGQAITEFAHSDPLASAAMSY